MLLRRYWLPLLATAVLSWAADPFVGEWKLNPKESRPAPEIKGAVTTWAPEGEGVRVTTTGTRENGMPFTESYLAFYDGVERASKGPWNFDAVINRQVNPREREAIFKRGGRIVGTMTMTVSEDGARLVQKTRFGEENSLKVFDRR